MSSKQTNHFHRKAPVGIYNYITLELPTQFERPIFCHNPRALLQPTPRRPSKGAIRDFEGSLSPTPEIDPDSQSNRVLSALSKTKDTIKKKKRLLEKLLQRLDDSPNLRPRREIPEVRTAVDDYIRQLQEAARHGIGLANDAYTRLAKMCGRQQAAATAAFQLQLMGLYFSGK
ncbi:hypothetical protein DL768_006072 [Monosporascus sp. mg162]|nr:hypothetical protein DL768_006072 [Monosporascus sp. mg162]